MIRFDRVRVETVGEISCELQAGATARIIFDSQEQNNELFGVLTGLRRPRAGEVRLLDRNLHALEETGRLACFQRVGVVPEDGGLISNLQAWENLMLPAWYHHGLTAGNAEPEVVQIFQRLGQGETSLRRWLRPPPGALSLWGEQAG